MKKLVFVFTVIGSLVFVGCKDKIVDNAGNVTTAIESNVTTVEGNATEIISEEGNITK